MGMICAISLCGFANLSSMGMCVGGIGVLCPEKRGTISRLVFKSMIGGVFVSIMSALLVSIVSLSDRWIRGSKDAEDLPGINKWKEIERKGD